MKGYDIAILLGYPEISGGTNVILEHALGLTRLGHAVSVVTELPIDPRRLAWKPGADALPLLCHADCRGRRFDLSLATWWRSVFDLPFVPARWYAYFCQSIESRFFSETDPDMKALVDYTYRQPLPVVTEAAWITDYLRKHYGREATLVLNGVDKRAFNADDPPLEPRPRDGLRVLVEGPLGVSFKRVELAISLCGKAGIDDVWLLTSSACESYPGVRRVLSRVPISEVGAVYRACDVLVKLSTVEGMFGPPLEMMHCGGTAITTDVTGHEQYMRHGENGIVVPQGNEDAVVRYLRALRRDRGYLDRLKAGARRTAQTWPDWPRSVQAMDDFVRGVCERDPSMERAQSDMTEQLRAALRLAAPLRHALRPEQSGRELLRLAGKRLLAKLSRALRGGWGPQQATPATAVPLPPPVPEAGVTPRIAARDVFRLAFVGCADDFGAHACGSTPQLTTCFIDSEREPREVARRLADFGPDCTFCFEPLWTDHTWLSEWQGFVFGFTRATCDPLDTRVENGLRRAFAVDKAARRALLVATPDAATAWLAKGVNVAGSFLLPVDAQRFSSTDDFRAWRDRDVTLLVRGMSLTPEQMWHLHREIPGVLHVGVHPRGALTPGVLCRTRMALHASDPDAAFGLPDGAVAVADIMCGVLVLARRFEVDYGLMPGEHYLHYETFDDLVSILRQQLDAPDERDVMRRRAQDHVRRYAACDVYGALLRRYSADGAEPDWSGRIGAPAEAVATP